MEKISEKNWTEIQEQWFSENLSYFSYLCLFLSRSSNSFTRFSKAITLCSHSISLSMEIRAFSRLTSTTGGSPISSDGRRLVWASGSLADASTKVTFSAYFVFVSTTVALCVVVATTFGKFLCLCIFYFIREARGKLCFFGRISRQKTTLLGRRCIFDSEREKQNEKPV